MNLPMPPARTGAVGKSFVFLGGLTEATETLMVFVLMCLWPQWFGALACGFAALCAVTVLERWLAAWKNLEES
jgi:phosphatidylglycerophosphate synthase